MIIIIIPGFFRISCLAPKEAGQAPCTFPAASHRPWEVTDTLAPACLGAGLGVGPELTCVWSEKFWADSFIYSQHLSLYLKSQHSFNSGRARWGLRGLSFDDGGNWGQRSDLSPQVTKLVSNRIKKRTRCVRQGSRVYSTSNTSISVPLLPSTVGVSLRRFLYLERSEIMILAYFEE